MTTFSTSSVLSYKLVEVIDGYGYNGNNKNNQNRAKPGNLNPHYLIQGNKAKCYHRNRQPKGKGNPFYDFYPLEEDKRPGKAGQKEDKYNPQKRSEDW